MAPHSTDFCEGNCPQHPLLRGAVLEMHLALSQYGMTWGDIAYFDDLAKEASKTLQQRQKEANQRAAEELMRSLDAESFTMKTHAERMAIVSRQGVKRGDAARKVQRPCKWLYCNEHAPKSQWRRDKDGKLCAPRVEHMTGAQCWAWEYTDPKTKQVKRPHTCPYLHPGEEGWHKEWETNAYWDPADAAMGRFAALKGRRNVAATH